MSRTFKDKPSKLKHEAWDKDTIRVEGTDTKWEYRIELPTTKTKKRKEIDTKDHWMSTPSWWTKLTMIKPERRSAHLLERKALIVEDLEDFEIPDLGRKPHIYYY